MLSPTLALIGVVVKGYCIIKSMNSLSLNLDWIEISDFGKEFGGMILYNFKLESFDIYRNG